MQKIQVFSRSGRLLDTVRPRKARALVRDGQAAGDGAVIRFTHYTDAELSKIQVEQGYDAAHAAGRTWHSQQPAASGFRRCMVAGMVYS